MIVDPSGYMGFWQVMAISIAVDLIVQGIINPVLPGVGVLVGDILSEALCTIIINAIDGEETSLGDIATNVLMGIVGGATMKGALGIITIGLKKAGLGKVISKVGKILKKKVKQPAREMKFKLDIQFFASKSDDVSKRFTPDQQALIALAKGRAMHKAYKADIADEAKGLYKEYNKIKGIRPDFVDFNTKTIYELKSNNPRAIALGNKQLQKYKSIFEQEHGGVWNIVLDTY